MKKFKSYILKSALSVFSALCILFLNVNTASAEQYSANTDYMAGKYGIFLHYLSTMVAGSGVQIDKWNEIVNSFDVESFAKQAQNAGASWVCITLTQGDGMYCIPMPELEKMIGGTKCSTDRDLVLDLYNALNPRGIKLMVYWIPGTPTTSNIPMAKALGAERLAKGDLAGGQNSGDFMLNWTVVKNMSSIMRTVSERYGDKVSGWWIDGCYDTIGFNERVAETEAKALRSGNPNAIIAFNNGTSNQDARFTSEDYTAGETGHPNTVKEDNLLNRKAEGRWSEQGYQQHYLTFLGTNWGTAGTVYDTGKLTEHCYNNILSKGAAITFDVRFSKSGEIDSEHLTQLSALKNYLSSKPEITLQTINDNRKADDSKGHTSSGSKSGIDKNPVSEKPENNKTKTNSSHYSVIIIIETAMLIVLIGAVVYLPLRIKDVKVKGDKK